MQEIKHTYTIQWVGPFSYKEYQEYIRNEKTLSGELFNFYYFEALIDARYKKRRYLGIHKSNDGINKRLNSSHEHLKEFLDAKDLQIWIGSFSHEDYQIKENIDIVETLLIQAYKDGLTENSKKRKSLPAESICIINMWFDNNEQLQTYARTKSDIFNDVLVYYEEKNLFFKGDLSKMKI
ncbi:MAG: hypothetical protein UHK44_07590 [Bacteroidaceae bacterium]|nr:hypothetical protein [Bacteroidaceae bacterium]